ncbi:hypothetical protein PoB_000852700 [Plakobranchus ocellatus]|uniref:Uncharacterized protein n=1 Tax=Plakobranchus ocellatus TaxID=259542 RepID=A0AAV3YGP5_9GAST|nr:hypothetical protein PoB_000852700 [Plakobranchus ocellatus]
MFTPSDVIDRPSLASHSHQTSPQPPLYQQHHSRRPVHQQVHSVSLHISSSAVVGKHSSPQSWTNISAAPRSWASTAVHSHGATHQQLCSRR